MLPKKVEIRGVILCAALAFCASYAVASPVIVPPPPTIVAAASPVIVPPPPTVVAAASPVIVPPPPTVA
jgi:hypothetical protein